MRKYYKHCLLIAIAAAVLVSFFYSIGFLSAGQSKIQDRLYGGRASDEIIIIAIDDKSIQKIGRWPWNREIYAQILPKLEKARVVGMDIIFPEASNKGNDTLFSEAMKKHGKVILAAEYSSFENKNGRVEGKDVMLPIQKLREAAAGVGIINLVTDRDGIVRSVNSNIRGDYELFAAKVAGHRRKVSVPNENKLLINMLGGKGTFKTIPFADFLETDKDSEIFNDKTVLIGATAPNLHDDHLTPASYGTKVPGIEVHANLIQQMLTRNYLHYQSNWSTILMIFAAALLASLLMIRFNPWVAAGTALLLLVVYYLATIKLFDTGIIADMVYAPLALTLSYLGNLIHLYVGAQKEKRAILKAWSKYVAPAVVNDLRRNPSKLALGGEKREVTIFFSDIRGFTTLSEKLTPEQLVQVLNEYLTAMTDIIMDAEGIVDKYIGDAIMAIWGAPLDQPDQAQRAVKATLKMNKELNELNKKFKERGWPEIAIGSGLNTGQAVIGNMGSHQRFDYTAMGDTVNLASRLEGLTKPYGVKVIVSESTKKKLPQEFIARELDLVAVKGKKEPIKIFELMGTKAEVTEKQKKIKKHFEKGLELYRNKKFKEAIKEFNEGAKLKDRTSKTFIERCEHFIKNKPPKEWNGVWVMTTK